MNSPSNDDCTSDEIPEFCEDDLHVPPTRSFFPLMWLPPEIRNHIYSFSLCKPLHPDLCAELFNHGSKAKTPPFWKHLVREQPSLTKVSRRVRDETLPIFYGQNTFHFFSEHSWFTYKHYEEQFDWLRRISLSNFKMAAHIHLYSPTYALCAIESTCEPFEQHCKWLLRKLNAISDLPDKMEWIENGDGSCCDCSYGAYVRKHEYRVRCIQRKPSFAIEYSPGTSWLYGTLATSNWF